MRGCVTGKTTQVLIGLHRIGLVGLRQILRRAASSGLTEREAVVDFIIDAVSADNYVPASDEENFRRAVWREYQRHRGEDIRDLYSEVEVVVRGADGEKRDQFVERVVSVFGDYELKPVVTFEPPSGRGLYPQLLLDGDPVVEGLLPRRAVKEAVKKRITDW